MTVFFSLLVHNRQNGTYIVHKYNMAMMKMHHLGVALLSSIFIYDGHML